MTKDTICTPLIVGSVLGLITSVCVYIGSKKSDAPKPVHTESCAGIRKSLIDTCDEIAVRSEDSEEVRTSVERVWFFGDVPSQGLCVFRAGDVGFALTFNYNDSWQPNPVEYQP
jgi:hypothetical protein